MSNDAPACVEWQVDGVKQVRPRSLSPSSKSRDKAQRYAADIAFICSCRFRIQSRTPQGRPVGCPSTARPILSVEPLLHHAGGAQLRARPSRPRHCRTRLFAPQAVVDSSDCLGRKRWFDSLENGRPLRLSCLLAVLIFAGLLWGIPRGDCCATCVLCAPETSHSRGENFCPRTSGIGRIRSEGNGGHCKELVSEMGKKKPARGGLERWYWWRWRESNSRPEALHSQDYMLSRVILLSSPNR
jgi:hypothetical protein